MAKEKAKKLDTEGEFASRFGFLVGRSGFTFDVLARETGLSKGFLYRLARGVQEPSFAVVCRLADVMCLSVEAFRSTFKRGVHTRTGEYPR